MPGIIEVIAFYVLLVDSVGANLTAWFGDKWYLRHFKTISKIFPPAKGWTLIYLLFVLWVGSILYRLGLLF